MVGLPARPHPQAHELTLWNVSARSIVVFIAAIAMVRIGAKRFLARATAFDIIVAFVLGSMLSRAINGSAAFLPTIAAGFVLVAFHRLLAALSFRWHFLGRWIKGDDELVIDNGKLRPAAMKKNYLTERDLYEELRLQGCEEVKEVRRARLERNGELSVIRAD